MSVRLAGATAELTDYRWRCPAAFWSGARAHGMGRNGFGAVRGGRTIRGPRWCASRFGRVVALSGVGLGAASHSASARMDKGSFQAWHLAHLARRHDMRRACAEHAMASNQPNLSIPSTAGDRGPSFTRAAYAMALKSFLLFFFFSRSSLAALATTYVRYSVNTYSNSVQSRTPDRPAS